MWLNGICASQISSQLGVKVSTIRQWVVRYGWKRDAKVEQPITEQLEAAVREDVAARITALAIEQSERIIGVIRDNKVKTLSDAKTAGAALATASATARKWLGLDNAPNVSTHLHYHVMRDAQAALKRGVIDVDVVESAESAVDAAAGSVTSPVDPGSSSATPNPA